MKRKDQENWQFKEERQARSLSRVLTQLDGGECPELEEIAALIDGRLNRNHRQRLMGHLASCEHCYEIFWLSSQATVQEKKPGRVPFKYLAAAASFFIVFFSVYMIFKLGWTQSEPSFSKMDKIPPTPPLTVSVEENQPSVTKKSNEIAQAQPQKMDSPGKGAIHQEKLYDSGSGEKAKTVAPQPEISRTRTETDKKEMDFVAMGKSQPQTLPERKMSFSDEKFTNFQSSPTSGSPSPPAVLAAGSRQKLDSVSLLNQELSQFKKYIPEDQLHYYFQQTLTLNQNLDKTDQKKTELPSLDFFLSKSKPGSVGYQFFQLAQSGYCFQNMVMGEKNPDTLWQESKTGDSTQKWEQARRNLLKKWLELKPHLNGVFLEIADKTIVHLKENYAK